MTASADALVAGLMGIHHKLVALVMLGYLLGSIPFGLLIGLIKGVDIRTAGSRNIGATNAGRVLGRKFFVVVLILDLLKGLIPTGLAGWMLSSAGVLSESATVGCFYWLMVGFAAVAGHNWPCWLKFKGGKGVATSLGVVLAIYPYYTYPGLVALVVWIVMVWITKYVSVGSISAAIVFLLTLLVLFLVHPSWRVVDHWPLLAFAAGMVVVLIFRHRSNIERLRRGTENKFMAGDGASES